MTDVGFSERRAGVTWRLRSFTAAGHEVGGGVISGTGRLRIR